MKHDDVLNISVENETTKTKNGQYTANKVLIVYLHIYSQKIQIIAALLKDGQLKQIQVF